MVLAHCQTGRNHGYQDGRYCETAVATCAPTLRPSGGAFADTKAIVLRSCVVGQCP